MSARRYLFVHGSWHGAWCFDLLRLELQRRAVECDAIDLPALGDFFPDAEVVEALERGLRVVDDVTTDDVGDDEVGDVGEDEAGEVREDEVVLDTESGTSDASGS